MAAADPRGARPRGGSGRRARALHPWHRRQDRRTPPTTNCRPRWSSPCCSASRAASERWESCRGRTRLRGSRQPLRRGGPVDHRRNRGAVTSALGYPAIAGTLFRVPAAVSCGVWSRPVVGGDGFLVGVDRCWVGEPRLSVDADFHVPVGVVQQGVVVAAEEDEVVEVGGSAVCPVLYVVAFAVAGGVPQPGKAQRGRGRSTLDAAFFDTVLLVAEVERDTVVHDDGGEVAVARDPPRGGDGQWPVWGRCAMSLSPNRSDPSSGGRPTREPTRCGRGRQRSHGVTGVAARRLDGGVAGVEVAAQDLANASASLPCRGAFFGGVLDRLPGFGQRGERGQEHFAVTASRSPLTRTRPFRVFEAWNSCVRCLRGREFVGFEDRSSRRCRCGRSWWCGGPDAASSNTFRQRIQRFVRHAARRGLAELPDQRRVLGGNIAGVEGVSDLGLPGEHPAQREDPCCGRHFQQRVRGQPLLDATKSRVSNETARASTSAAIATRNAWSRSISRQTSAMPCTRAASASDPTSPGRSEAAAMPELLSPPGF